MWLIPRKALLVWTVKSFCISSVLTQRDGDMQYITTAAMLQSDVAALLAIPA